MNKREVAFSELDRLERTLSGMVTDSLPHKLLYRFIDTTAGICMIYFEREGDNVRATKSSRYTEAVIGIPQHEIDGHLLTDFVNTPLDEVRRSINYVDKYKFMVKTMALLDTGIHTRALIMAVGKGKYVEITWRIADEK